VAETAEDLKAGPSEDEEGGAARFFNRKILVTKSLPLHQINLAFFYLEKA